jgi:hypothetical protein
VFPPKCWVVFQITVLHPRRQYIRHTYHRETSNPNFTDVWNLYPGSVRYLYQDDINGYCLLLAWLIFESEDGGDISLWNIGLFPRHMALQPWRQFSFPEFHFVSNIFHKSCHQILKKCPIQLAVIKLCFSWKWWQVHLLAESVLRETRASVLLISRSTIVVLWYVYIWWSSCWLEFWTITTKQGWERERERERERAFWKFLKFVLRWFESWSGTSLDFWGFPYHSKWMCEC